MSVTADRVPSTVDGAAAGAGRAGLRAMARGGVAGIAGAGFAAVAGIGVTWLAARGLGPERAGAFFAATALFVLVGAVAKLGTQTGLVYWPARLRARGQGHLLGSCLRAGLTPVAGVSAVLGAGLLVAAPALARLTAGGAGPDTVAQHTAGLRALAVFVPLAAFADAALAATRGYRQLQPTLVLDRVARPVLQLAGVATVTVAAGSLAAYAVAWALPYLPVAALAGYALARTHRTTAPPLRRPAPGPRPAPAPGPGPAPAPGPAKIRVIREYVARRAGDTRDLVPDHANLGGRGRVERAVWRGFWGFGWPRALGSVGQLALQRVDLLLVAGLGGLGAAALYAVAGRFVVLGQLANQGISQSVQPRLAEALAIGDRAAANRLYQVATGWLVLATWPLYLLLLSYAPLYLGFFGDAYRDGGPIVAVLAGAMLLSTGCGMVDMVLAMAGRTSWNLANVAVALGVTVALDLALIPRLGALGAAIGLAAAVAVNNLLPLAQVGLALGLHPFGRGTLTAAALAVGCFGVLPRIFVAVAGSGPAAAFAAVVAATGVYLAGARLLRGPLALDALRRRGRPRPAPALRPVPGTRPTPN
ncbi:polysaccharide biosynthesis C-terminal domain-containing protein [Polymorphospora rubra]|uniref:polysaccharide biosynthesis C-terminal domain-containing protein n=1 Tax=Polymorphospora rubra TaxID=338584 RepID=UPI00340387BB